MHVVCPCWDAAVEHQTPWFWNFNVSICFFQPNALKWCKDPQSMHLDYVQKQYVPSLRNILKFEKYIQPEGKVFFIIVKRHCRVRLAAFKVPTERAPFACTASTCRKPPRPSARKVWGFGRFANLSEFVLFPRGTMSFREGSIEWENKRTTVRQDHTSILNIPEACAPCWNLPWALPREADGLWNCIPS